ncbi:MAG: aminotransferase class V-fold PLP-dependent enzyme [Pirellulales bacterium]
MPDSIDDDDAWYQWRDHWNLRADTIYLNHGSFGPPPASVRTARREWIDRLDGQPMDFFVRTLESDLIATRKRLAEFIGTTHEHLAFVENATSAMNVVANSFSLQPEDEVILTDHEYGAVNRIWNRKCANVGASPPRIAKLPLPFESADQIVNALFRGADERTRLIVVSHITSNTATILPVAEICAKARSLGIAVCIDGPHAPAQVPLDIDALDCDFYTASLHKWLCAPFGSGFLWVHPRQQQHIQNPNLSWGRLLPDKPETWDEEFTWTGTRDPSAYLTVPTAIDFLQQVGLESFRARTHHLAQYARRRLVELTGQSPIVPDSDQWYGSMALVPLPSGDACSLQRALWANHGIEVPIIDFDRRRYIRVSCHLYNDKRQIDQLCRALSGLL